MEDNDFGCAKIVPHLDVREEKFDMNKTKPTILTIVAMGILAATTLFADPQMRSARMFYEHGLNADAKRELIRVIAEPENANLHPEAYYLLGVIAFDERRVATALGTWRELLERYTGSEEAALVEERIQELSQIVDESQQETIDNVILQGYLRHGDFWSRRKSSVFTIDSSWISNIEAAIKWYDKAIEEFPDTPGARRAFEEKLRTLLGWEDPGRYGSIHGLQGSFDTYMPTFLETFENFESMFPEASTLQAFRYQIAQAYWGQKDWANTRKWLNAIIEKSDGVDTFYSDLAKRRLKKVEY